MIEKEIGKYHASRNDYERRDRLHNACLNHKSAEYEHRVFRKRKTDYPENKEKEEADIRKLLNYRKIHHTSAPVSASESPFLLLLRPIF
jgi:hypothetical protein